MTKPTDDAPKGELILYQTEDGRTRIECRFAGETVWLTQALMAELFQTTPQNINQHLREIYAEGELDEAATCKAFLQVRTEGARQVSRTLRFYNLEVCRLVLRAWDPASSSRAWRGVGHSPDQDSAPGRRSCNHTKSGAQSKPDSLEPVMPGGPGPAPPCLAPGCLLGPTPAGEYSWTPVRSCRTFSTRSCTPARLAAL